MAERKSKQREKLQVAATAPSVPEAEVICQRLADAGIHGIWQRTKGGPEWGLSGAQYVYVEADQLERAREILEADEDISEEELIRAAEEDAVMRDDLAPPE
jgi:hypothetical protein